MRSRIAAVLLILIPASVLAADLPAGHPPIDSQAPTAESEATHSGSVLEALPAGSYVYVRVKGDNGEEWLAGPATDLKVGSKVQWNDGHEMTNFTSPSMKRTFDKVRFVEILKVAK
jgi:hypothetical protein